MGRKAIARRKLDLVLAGLLLLLPLLLFWRVIFAGEVLYWGTPLLQFFPWRKFAVESYLAGQVPLWNPYLGNGAPFAANWQSAVFYPLNAIYFLAPVEKAMGYSVALHIGLAGVFMYVFGRALGLSGFGSFIAGLSYAFGGFMVSRAGFLSMTSTAAWLPLIMAFVEVILRRKTIGRGVIGSGLVVSLGSLAVGFQLLAGHGQLSFYSLVIALLYALYRAWQLSGQTGICSESGAVDATEPGTLTLTLSLCEGRGNRMSAGGMFSVLAVRWSAWMTAVKADMDAHRAPGCPHPNPLPLRQERGQDSCRRDVVIVGGALEGMDGCSESGAGNPHPNPLASQREREEVGCQLRRSSMKPTEASSSGARAVSQPGLEAYHDLQIDAGSGRPAGGHGGPPLRRLKPELFRERPSAGQLRSADDMRGLNKRRWRLRCGAAAMLPVLGMLALGLGLAAVQLLLTAELALSSVRAGGAEYDFAMAYSLWPWQLVGLIAPDFFGNPAMGDYWGPGAYWEASGYVGVFPLLAAGAGLLAPSKPSRCPKLFLLGIIAVALLFAVGRYLPIYPFVFAHVPGFGFFQAPARFLFWYTFAVSILAGIGSDALAGRASAGGIGRPGKTILVAGIGISLAMAAFVMVLGGTEGVRPTFVGAVGRLGVLLTASGLVLLLGARLPKVWWQVAVGVVVVFDLMAFGYALNPSTEARAYEGSETAATAFLKGKEGMFRVYTPEAAFLGKFFATHSFRTFGSGLPFDVKRLREMVIPDLAMAAGIQESYNYDPLQVGTSREFLKAVDASGLSPRLLGLMNVRYVLSDTVPAASGLRPVSREGSLVYENSQPVERAFVVTGEVVKADSNQEAFRRLQDPRFDPTRAVILGESGASSPLDAILRRFDRLYPVSPSGSESESGRAGAAIVEYEPGRVRVAVSTEEAGYLVLSDTYYPGWKAWVNDEPAEVRRANVAFRAVAVPAGRSMVELRYEPVAFKLGALITLLSMATVAFIVASAVRRRKAG